MYAGFISQAKRLRAIFIQFVSHAIKAHPNITDPEERYLSRILNSLLLIYVPIALSVTTFRIITSPNNLSTTFTIVILGMMVVGIIYAVGRSGHYRASVITAVTLGYTIIYLNAMNSTPPHSEISYLIFMPLLGIVLFTPYEAIIVYFINIILLAIFIITMPTMGSDGRIDTVVFVILSLGFIMFANFQRNRLDQNRRDLALEQQRSALTLQLINNVSHDFRTPLSVIRTSTHILQKVDLPERRELAINRIERQADRLDAMIQNLLMVAQLDAKSTIEMTLIDLPNMLDTVHEAMCNRASISNIELNKYYKVISPHFNCDPALIKLMMNKLVENAISYTPSGGQVTIRLCDAEDGYIMFEVEDTGIGIPESDLAHIFKRFYRVDEARRIDSGENGLGLSIAKRIVDLHQGTISVKSQVDQGSIFSVKLPILPVQAQS